MHPVDILAREHQLIVRMCRVLAGLVSLAESGQEVSKEDLARVVRMFREQIDLVHHEKEETVLFEELVLVGVDWNSGELTRVRQEHQQERYLLRSLRHSALQQPDWSAEDKRHFVSVARELLVLQRSHLAHEAEHLFPVIRSHLREDRIPSVLAEFERLDRLGSPLEGLLGELDQLEERYAP